MDASLRDFTSNPGVNNVDFIRKIHEIHGINRSQSWWKWLHDGRYIFTVEHGI